MEGYGKLILFGEHFVVYGLPAIAASTESLKIEVSLTNEEQRYEEKEKLLIEKIYEIFGIKINFKVLRSNIPIKSGLGSSAALIVAILKAMNQKYELNLKEKDIIKYGTELENIYHGKSSGLDISLAIRPRAIIYRAKNFALKELNNNWEIGLKYIILPKRKPTEEAVKEVSEKMQQYSIYKDIFRLYRRLFKEALNTVKEKNLAKLGLLMDINHSLLYSLGVSNEDVEKTVFELRRSCYGAKVCGGGHGGLVIGLTKDNPDIKIKL